MKNNENNQPDNSQENFGLPNGYFQKSAGSIFNAIEWQEEHSQFPTLVQYKNKHGFRTPENYFTLNEQTLELVEFPALAAIYKTNPFNTPHDYFNASEHILLSKHLSVNANDVADFETLAALKTQTSFRTPDDYFTQSAAKLATLLEPKKEAKVMALFSAKTWYAVAALLVIALGLWTYSRYDTPAETKDCGTLACIDKTDLVKTKTLENLDNEDLYEIVNSKKLEEKLNAAPAKKTDIKEDSSSKTDAVDDLLDEI